MAHGRRHGCAIPPRACQQRPVDQLQHRRISGHGFSHGGSWEPTITVSNGTYSDTESHFNWTVNSFVSITDPGDQMNQVRRVRPRCPSPAVDAALSGTLFLPSASACRLA